MPGQGKSSAARVIMAGAALDPTAELRIWVPDANFDFEAFAPRCSRYVMGAEDDQIAADPAMTCANCTPKCRPAASCSSDHESPRSPASWPSPDVGLHPLVCAAGRGPRRDPAPRSTARRSPQLLIDIVKLGRKRGIHLIVSTQAPTKDSMPRDVTRNCSNGIAFAVGDHVANDALLGQGAYASGHRATELIPGTDKGTALVKGFTGERSDIVQVYFLDVAKDT